jgi:peptidoglycan/xylan/chitin deacetylase (PgdA/CDA1 family)
MFDRSTILAFHQTSQRFYPGINNLKPGYFYAVIDLCQSWGFMIWNKSETDHESADKPPLVITFDDGYADNFDVIAWLCERKITPMLFVPTDYIGRRNRWEYSSRLFPADHLGKRHLRELAEMGTIIGSHGTSHRALTTMTADRLQRELADSKRRLEDITGQPVEYISYPFGRTNANIDAAARECGYTRAFGLGGGNGEGENRGFVLPRTAVYSIDDYFSLRAKIVCDTPRERRKNRTINDLSAGTIILSRRLN